MVASSSRGFSCEALKRLALRFDARAEVLDLTLGFENAARLPARATGDKVRTTEDVAFGRRNGQRSDRARLRSVRIGIGDPRAADRMTNRTGVHAVNPDNRRQGDSARRYGARISAWRRHRGIGSRNCNQKSAAARPFLAQQFESGRRVLGPLDDDVLQQIGEARLDGALVAGLYLEVVCDGALLSDAAVRLDQQRAGGVAETGPRRIELLE